MVNHPNRSKRDPMQTRAISFLAGLLAVGTVIALVLTFDRVMFIADKLASADSVSGDDRAIDAAVMFFGGLGAIITGILVYAGFKRW